MFKYLGRVISADGYCEIGGAGQWTQQCVQLRRLPARRLCQRLHGMAPVAGECTARIWGKYECYIL